MASLFIVASIAVTTYLIVWGIYKASPISRLVRFAPVAIAAYTAYTSTVALGTDAAALIAFIVLLIVNQMWRDALQQIRLYQVIDARFTDAVLHRANVREHSRSLTRGFARGLDPR